MKRKKEKILNDDEKDALSNHGVDLLGQFNKLLDDNNMGHLKVTGVQLGLAGSIRCCAHGEQPVLIFDQFGNAQLSCVFC